MEESLEINMERIRNAAGAESGALLYMMENAGIGNMFDGVLLFNPGWAGVICSENLTDEAVSRIASMLIGGPPLAPPVDPVIEEPNDSAISALYKRSVIQSRASELSDELLKVMLDRYDFRSRACH